MRLRCSGALLLFALLLPILFTEASEQTDPCLDRNEVVAENLKLPSKYVNLTEPWRRADGKLAKVIRSDGLNYQWGWMKALYVQGLLKSVEEVVQFLTENNCLFVPIGSFVRSALLAQKSVYLSGEVSCELEELFPKCVEKFGGSGCSLFPQTDGVGSIRLEIGDVRHNRSTNMVRAEPVVLFQWRAVLGAPRENWRFTVDTLAMYDDGAGDLLVIDPTGVGYKHTCDKKLVPAEDDWTKWSRDSMKVIGFYDLRTNGFAPQNETLQKFVNKEIQKADVRTAEQFYCEHVLQGIVDLSTATPVCYTTYPQKEAVRKIGAIRNVMISEMGSVWNSSVGKAADELEAVYVTAQQFGVKRAHLLNKLHSEIDDTPSTAEPRIIEKGRPMLNDSSQVHSRPIFDMGSAEPAELPKEFPSAPRAEPNERLDFVEPPVDGAGSEPMAVMHGQAPDYDDHLEPEEELLEPTLIVGGVRATEEQEAADMHNSMSEPDRPVMRFDKVEEAGLGDMAASAQEISTSSATSSGFLSQLLIILNLLVVIVFYL